MRVLVTCILIIISLRLYTYNEPLERDITTYAVVAHEMLQGRDLYSDLWDHKPPLLYYTFAVSELFFGYGELSIFFLNVFSSVLSLVAIFLITRSLGGNSNIGSIAWTFASGALGIQGNQPNVEVFINLSLLWGLYFSLNRKSNQAAIFFTFASLFKQIAILFPLLVLPLLANKKQLILRSVVFGILSWGIIFLIFGSSLYECVFVYNSKYAGDPFDNIIKGFSSLAPEFCIVLLPLAVSAVIGVFASSQRVLLLAMLISAFIMVSLPGKFYPHYYQLFLPFLCLASSFAPRIIATISILLVLVIEAPNYMLSPSEWSVKKYGEVFVKSKEMGLKLKSALPSETLLYQHGAETGLYFYSKLSPASGVFYDYPLKYGPFTKKLKARVENDLRKPVVQISNNEIKDCEHSAQLSEAGFKVYFCR